MCRKILRKWNTLRSTYAADMLKGEFPKCGVKYTGKYGQGLVLALYHVPADVVISKAAASSSKISNIFIIPKSVARVYGLDIPTLTDVVA